MGNRRVHYIKKNHNTEVPYNAIWFDTETIQDVDDFGRLHHKLGFVVANYSISRGNNSWDSPESFRAITKRDFWNWVDSKARPKTRLYLFCHNTNFDLPVLDVFNELKALHWELKTAIIDAPPTILKFRKGSATIEVLDTLNIWRMPLKKLGTIVGLDKLEMPKGMPEGKDWDTYAFRDVEIIRVACQKWWKFIVDNDLGGFAPTLASQSHRIFRHKYMKHPILIDVNKPALNLSRASYLGARTEAFQLGDIQGPIYVLDVNSLYPFVMTDRLYPSKLIGYTDRVTVTDLVTWLESKAVVAEVEIITNEPAYPLVYNKRLVFSVGSFRTILASPELKYALSKGHVTKVIRAAVYEQADMFSDFIRDFYKLRREAADKGDTASAHNFKILINSFYGKFGQRGIVWDSYTVTDDLSAKVWEEYDAETDTLIKWRQLSGLVQRQKTESESFESFPAIASHVTSYARMHLYGLLKTAGAGNVYYSDTDSLFVSEAGFTRLKGELDDAALGKLKIVEVSKSVKIYGLKDYVLDSGEKHKGIRKNAIRVRDDLYFQEKWSSLRGLLRAGSMDAPLTEYVPKELHRIYTKGIVKDTGEIVPFRFNLAYQLSHLSEFGLSQRQA